MNLNLSLLIPEWVLTGFLVLLILREIFKGSTSGKTAGKMAMLGVIASGLSVFTVSGKTDAAFGGMFLLDPYACFFKVLFTLAAVTVIQMAKNVFADGFKYLSEYFLIIFCTLIGLFFMVSANDFLLIFIALEIVTLSFYITAAYSKNKIASIEAGLKYLIMGSLASAFMIFGISLLYSAAGSTAFPDVRAYLAGNSYSPLILTAIFMILAGIGFKIAAFPFQFWVPDVYEGAPIPTVAFLSVASKTAGFAILLRVLFSVFGPFPADQSLFIFLAAATLLYGNFGALLQTNIKRLLGYSSIGHAGYLLIAVAAGQNMGKQALLYYLIAYSFSTLAAFLVISKVSQELASDHLESYRGLAKRAPFLAGLLFISLLSLAGVPPLAGFSGKFLVLFAAVKSGLNLLAVIGALAVAISLYYYLNVVRIMYFEESSQGSTFSPDTATKILLFLLVAGIFLAGIWHAPFYQTVKTAADYLA